jgi:hypothetical protein
MEQEIWKDIPWYEWKYQASNLGRIKSLITKLKTQDNVRILSRRKVWYLYTELYKNNIWKKYQVHRLVCLTFIPNPENKEQVNHINWIKDDNRLENLEWCTQSENQKHRYSVLWHKNNFQTNHPSKWKFWKDNPRAKKVNQYDLNWNFIKTWDSARDITRELNYHYKNISACILWKTKTSNWYIWKF